MSLHILFLESSCHCAVNDFPKINQLIFLLSVKVYYKNFIVFLPQIAANEIYIFALITLCFNLFFTFKEVQNDFTKC